jgi:hypothetical protein
MFCDNSIFASLSASGARKVNCYQMAKFYEKFFIEIVKNKKYKHSEFYFAWSILKLFVNKFLHRIF